MIMEFIQGGQIHDDDGKEQIVNRVNREETKRKGDTRRNRTNPVTRDSLYN